MRKQPQPDRGYDAGKAYQIREQRALQQFDVADRKHAIVTAVLSQMDGLEYSEITPFLKERGGWSALIKEQIGAEPAHTTGELGFIEEPEWYLWKHLHDVSKVTPTLIVLDSGGEFDRYRRSDGYQFAKITWKSRITGVATPEESATWDREQALLAERTLARKTQQEVLTCARAELAAIVESRLPKLNCSVYIAGETRRDSGDYYLQISDLNDAQILAIVDALATLSF